MSKPKVLIVCSGGGAVFDTVYQAFGKSIDFHLFVDRACGAVEVAQKNDVPFEIAIEKDKYLLSEKIFYYTQKIQADLLVCYFGRLLGAPLIDIFPCYNVHPAVLPKYPGLGAEKRAFEAQDNEVGATLHRIDAGIDTGQILYQSWFTLEEEKTLEAYNRLAYIAKTKVSFCFFEELLNAGQVVCVGFGKNCDISSQEYREKFQKFLRELD